MAPSSQTPRGSGARTPRGSSSHSPRGVRAWKPTLARPTLQDLTQRISAEARREERALSREGSARPTPRSLAARQGPQYAVEEGVSVMTTQPSEDGSSARPTPRGPARRPGQRPADEAWAPVLQGRGRRGSPPPTPRGPQGAGAGAVAYEGGRPPSTEDASLRQSPRERNLARQGLGAPSVQRSASAGRPLSMRGERVQARYVSAALLRAEQLQPDSGSWVASAASSRRQLQPAANSWGANAASSRRADSPPPAQERIGLLAKGAEASPSPPTSPLFRSQRRDPRGKAAAPTDTSAASALQLQMAVEAWNAREPSPGLSPDPEVLLLSARMASSGGHTARPPGGDVSPRKAGRGGSPGAGQAAGPPSRPRSRRPRSRPRSSDWHGDRQAPSAYLLRAPLQVRCKVEEGVFASTRLRDGVSQASGERALESGAVADMSPVLRLCPWCGQARPEQLAGRPEVVARCIRCGRSFNPSQAKDLKW
uniref:Uncharacterized protein n=1 Tax=Alexandrium monilatum TaxID=311494 RepID=A0A7S4TAB1_9DINO